jgi:hypothetical protein
MASGRGEVRIRDKRSLEASDGVFQSMSKKGGMIRNVSAQDGRYGLISEQLLRDRRSASARHDIV